MNDWNNILSPQVLWAVAGLIMLMMEFALPGLVIFFFGVGALIVALVCLFMDLSLNMQLGLFVVASVALLVALRRWARSIFFGRTSDEQDTEQNLQAFIGEVAVVTQRITPPYTGKVEFHGSAWKAEADVEIDVGTEVEIVKQENLTLTVKPR